MSERPNPILEFLNAPAKPPGEACRTNSRRPSGAKVQFAWFDGTNWRTVRARLRDISRGGAGLLTVQPAPLSRRARLRFLEGETEGSPWMEGEILETISESAKRHRTRMRFEDPCPNFVLRLAVVDAAEVQPEIEIPRYEWVTTDTDESRPAFD